MARNWSIVNELCAIAHEQANKENQGGVILLFDDGEIVFTKGGSLFGQRTMHQFEAPLLNETDNDRAAGFVAKVFGYKCVYLRTSAEAAEIRIAMVNAIVGG